MIFVEDQIIVGNYAGIKSLTVVGRRIIVQRNNKSLI